jgi:hypothetical protein
MGDGLLVTFNLIPKNAFYFMPCARMVKLTISRTTVLFVGVWSLQEVVEMLRPFVKENYIYDPYFFDPVVSESTKYIWRMRGDLSKSRRRSLKKKEPIVSIKTMKGSCPK